jgi:CYTH domain-containing protein
MREARITINDRELSEPQSRTVRVAIIAFLAELQSKEVSGALGQIGVDYHLRLTEVMRMIDETGGSEE